MRTGGGHRRFWGTTVVFIGCWLGGLLFDGWLIVRLQGQQMGAAALVGLAVAICVEPEKKAMRVYQMVFRPEAPKNRDYPL